VRICGVPGRKEVDAGTNPQRDKGGSVLLLVTIIGVVYFLAVR
jgi:hypothetical protein